MDPEDTREILEWGIAIVALTISQRAGRIVEGLWGIAAEALMGSAVAASGASLLQQGMEAQEGDEVEESNKMRLNVEDGHVVVTVRDLVKLKELSEEADKLRKKDAWERAKKVTMSAVVDGNTQSSSALSFTEAAELLDWNWWVAVRVAALRLVFWHLLQPALYFTALYAYAEVIDETQRRLAIAVAVRESIYALVTLWAAVRRPQFLLWNVASKLGNSNEDFFGSFLLELGLYVFVPEKVVAATFQGRVMFTLWAAYGVFDVCGLAALIVGAQAEVFPAALAIGYVLTTLGLLFTVPFGLAALLDNNKNTRRVGATGVLLTTAVLLICFYA